MTSTTSRQFTYPQAIVETARRNGWDVRSEKTAGNAALVVTDGRSTVRHRVGGEAKAAYEARLDYEEIHRAAVAAYGRAEAPR